MSKKFALIGIITTLGIVYGDIGTSPLYVMSAILHANNNIVDPIYVIGGVSLVIWTLTLQTTIKYVLRILKVDNNGEGGILSLYSLIKSKAKWLLIPAIIGSAALLADSVITPAVTVTSAVEGLDLIINLNLKAIIFISFIIITVLFCMQRKGTQKIGKLFGPIMVLWFLMLAVLGIISIDENYSILKAFNPIYGINLLISGVLDGRAALILGAVFLCTTGAEALYSDLGHCGRKNIHITWIFVKISLILNYLGQGAILLNLKGQEITANPFYMMMPKEFLVFGIILATMAAIIASQSLISGSYTLVSEAIKLRIFPKLKILYPSNERGQLYIPTVNTALYLGCIFVLFYFKESSKMEAAYGLSITVAMLMTTILYFNYVIVKNKIKAYIFLVVYLIIEGLFLVANLFKFLEGGYVTVIIATVIILLMYIWHKGNIITDSLQSKVSLKSLVKKIDEIQSSTLYASNLVYMVKSSDEDVIDMEVAYSIFKNGIKVCNRYWFVNIIYDDKPFTTKYSLDMLSDKVFKVNLILGFRVNPKIECLLQEVIDHMIDNNELISDKDNEFVDRLGNFKYVVFSELYDDLGHLSSHETFILNSKLYIKNFAVSPLKWYGLDALDVVVEKYPIKVGEYDKVGLIRI